MNLTVRCLKFCPLHHVSLMWARNFLKVHEVKEVGTWVYMILTPEKKTVYVGETGGKTNQRTIMQRFGEHLLKAQKSKRSPSVWKNGLYKQMLEVGLHQWAVVPLQIKAHKYRLKDEAQWVHFMPQVYNVNKNGNHGNWVQKR